MKNLYKIEDELYIVSSSEKIKENTQSFKQGLDGDWFYNTIYNFIARVGDITPYDFKVILTTNKLLIKDGVQSIDDEFLEWICKNPSCEDVKVQKVEHLTNRPYRVVIPKKELSPFELPKTLPDNVFYESLEPKQETSVIEDLKDILNHVKKMNDGHQKKETIEDAAESYTPERIEQKAFIAGAKFQQKQTYSKEDMINFAWYLKESIGIYANDKTAHFNGEYLKRFKNKKK